ncbi:MAG: hypothetical protein KDD62_14835, partial [Bdellovibrionales bacterium]|nr:hypothetical protein [Bdellovibrionales bacterium]
MNSPRKDERNVTPQPKHDSLITPALSRVGFQFINSTDGQVTVTLATTQEKLSCEIALFDRKLERLSVATFASVNEIAELIARQSGSYDALIDIIREQISAAKDTKELDLSLLGTASQDLKNIPYDQLCEQQMELVNQVPPSLAVEVNEYFSEIPFRSRFALSQSISTLPKEQRVALLPKVVASDLCSTYIRGLFNPNLGDFMSEANDSPLFEQL